MAFSGFLGQCAWAQHPSGSRESSRLAMMAEEFSWRSDSGSSVSSSCSNENNVGNDALFVNGLHGSGQWCTCDIPGD